MSDAQISFWEEEYEKESSMLIAVDCSVFFDDHASFCGNEGDIRYLWILGIW